MTPIADEITRAESLHGPLPLHIAPSHDLINAAAYMESIARTEDPMSALAILCEEVGEVARAAPEDLPAELAQVIAVAVRWRRALGCVDDMNDAEVERLRAGGCARDQRTTQFCAEAVAKDAEIGQLRAECDAFGIYRDLTTTALGIEPASCADDVREAIEGMVATIEESARTLAAEQMRQEGAPSNRWRWSVYRSAWVMPYAIEDLPAKYRYPWSDTCRDHDPICIVSRLGSEWRLRWRDMTKPTTVHQTARDAMQTATAQQERP